MNKAKLFCHPKIHTLNKYNDVISWFLTFNGYIIASGQEKDKIPSIDYEKIDLEGKVVIPGFIDSHIHLGRYVFQHFNKLPNEKKAKIGINNEWLNWQDFTETDSIQDFISILKEKVKITPKGSWILGGGLFDSISTEINVIKELDKISKEHPIFIESFTLHSAVANSLALKLSGITENTKDPSGGYIERVPITGELTGRLYERAASIVTKNLPKIKQYSFIKTLEEVMTYLNSYGIVGIHDMESEADYDIFPMLSKLLAGNPDKFTVRCLCSIKLDHLDKYLDMGLIPGAGNEYLKVGPLKMIHDGALGNKTALMKKKYPYLEKPYWGEELITRGELKNVARRANLLNIPLAIHAIGDRAVENVTEIFEESFADNKIRHRIEHIQIANHEIINRLAKKGVVFSVQPFHTKYDSTLIKKLYPELEDITHAYRDMINSCKENNSQLALGTDFPIIPINPFETIDIAILREGRHKLSLEEILKAYTYGAAFAASEEKYKGALEKGKLADFIVLSEDIFRNCNKIKNTKILATYVGSRKVYSC